MIALAAWRPFLDPLALHQPWHALVMSVPLVVAIALVYKALKLETLERLAYETAHLSLYILALMATAAAILWAIVELL